LRMSTDRKTLLERHAKATAAIKHPNTPPEVKAAARKLQASTDALLSLQDAFARKKAKMDALMEK